MAKSLRSKVKRNFRSKKRESGVYAATEAARLHRLNAKLNAVIKAEKTTPEENQAEAEDSENDNMDTETEPTTEPMQIDNTTGSSKPVSTHGRSLSRREEWRLSKGMSARAESRGLNRQGVLAARRKSGRSKRRR